LADENVKKEWITYLDALPLLPESNNFYLQKSDYIYQGSLTDNCDVWHYLPCDTCSGTASLCCNDGYSFDGNRDLGGSSVNPQDDSENNVVLLLVILGVALVSIIGCVIALRLCKKKPPNRPPNEEDTTPEQELPLVNQNSTGNPPNEGSSGPTVP